MRNPNPNLHEPVRRGPLQPSHQRARAKGQLVRVRVRVEGRCRGRVRARARVRVRGRGRGRGRARARVVNPNPNLRWWRARRGRARAGRRCALPRAPADSRTSRRPPSPLAECAASRAGRSALPPRAPHRRQPTYRSRACLARVAVRVRVNRQGEAQGQRWGADRAGIRVVARARARFVSG